MFCARNKYTSIFLLIIFFTYILSSLFSSSIIVDRVEAATIEKEDIYKGVGIALILILLAKLGKSTEAETISEMPPEDISQSDLDLLARVIYAESRGEPYRGQVAVGAVVLNRLKSPDFPNNIRDIIYQKGQFSSVDDGQINLIPNSTAYRAARDALKGIDPSLGALYFYNPETAKSLWWLSTREVTVKIGNHVFAK